MSRAVLVYYLKQCESGKAQQSRVQWLQMDANITNCPVKSEQLPSTHHSKAILGCINFSATVNIFQSMCKITCPRIHQSAQWTFINLLLLFLSSFFLAGKSHRGFFFSFQHFSIWYYTKAGCCLHIGLVYAIHYKVQKWHDRKEKKTFKMSNLKKKKWAANPTAIFIRQLSWLLLWSGHKLELPAVSWWAQGFGSPHISSAIDLYTSALIFPMVQLKKPTHGKQLLCLNHFSLKHHCQGAAKHCWGKVYVRILPDGFVQKLIIK